MSEQKQAEQSNIDQCEMDALVAIAAEQLAHGDEVRGDDLSHVVLRTTFSRLEARGLIRGRRYPGHFDQHGKHHDPGWMLYRVTSEGLTVLWSRRS